MVALNTVFDLLRKERRRYALYHLDQQEGTVPIEELTEQVARWEDDSEDEPTTEEYERVELSLHHTHLPKTANAEFIEYDAEAGEVNVRGTPAEFEAVLTIAEVLEDGGRSE
ncbi:DUF7344 domain-containing protein [Halalkalicoccus jeotgali]|uniref:DUF7344 domain-containing protein n=1 Tax=Halalkalicoccus jeotgali (strain DSM 18796 / CECT 7217 / JCM 14584 / KCTC 4019 / B3) TaxID=795797 RepID=D8J4H0_HALJB|nr:hypothetical protein [Halalkalicoccus jeotgali]ADJ13532.1 hypothetical protein HacjB3_00695 [Halalkalicoccus jeotgali B3]ELY32993.1 hypothetical protein C497_18637 [Halalkalicoccus jeotgali B3]